MGGVKRRPEVSNEKVEAEGEERAARKAHGWFEPKGHGYGARGTNRTAGIPESDW
jgi:hypothetical protein